LLSGGLADLVESFKKDGQGEAADAWVRQGPNKQIAPSQLEQAIGPDLSATLTPMLQCNAIGNGAKSLISTAVLFAQHSQM
jgi:uncharacterized protein YidB (DUF937 family)